MKSISTFFFLSLICLFISCSDGELDLEPFVDTEGPEITKLRWLDYLNRGSSYAEPIEAGGNYRISTAWGFRMHMEVKDRSLIEWANVYALVNNDPNLKLTIMSDEVPRLSYDFSLGYSYESVDVLIGPAKYYTIKPGDRYHFYASFTDEFGNKTNQFWTADIIE